MNTEKTLLKDARVSRSEILIVLFLSINNGFWLYGQEKLSLVLGLSRRTVHRSIKDLEKFGYLEKKTSSNSRVKNIYLLTE